MQKSVMIGVGLILISSFTPSGAFFDSGYAADGGGYLSEQDIAFNLEQLATSEDGYLIKSTPQTANSNSLDRLETIEHEVQEGESIATIAQEYDLNTDTIIWENNIVNVEEIKPSQTLKIPPADGINHIVKRGEVLGTIASKYDVDSLAIQKYNSMDTARVRLGEELFIPGGKRITTSVAVASNDTEPVQETETATEEDTTRVASAVTDVEPINFTPTTSIESNSTFVQDAAPTPNPQEAQQSAEQGSTANPAVQNQAAPTTEGFWGKPTNGQISQGYRRGHYALDIANRTMPAIWSASEGMIVTAKNGWNGGYGNHVIIDHGNGYKTLYAHMNELYVEPGQSVAKGQVLGQMGNTGRVYGATGIHLHYECHYNGVKINPYECMP